MSYFQLTRNKFINEYEIDFLLSDLEFNDDEIELVKYIWIDDFNWENINTIKEDNGSNIPMNLVLQMTDELLKNNFLINRMWLDKDTLISAYSYILAKLVVNKNFNINSSSLANSTLLSNVIGTNSTDVLIFLLKNRNDLNIDQYISTYWNTYFDLAKGIGHLEIADILKNHHNNKNYSMLAMVWSWNKKSIEELLSDWDFLWIVEYCKNGTLMWNPQEIALGLYNIANQAWQHYNNNELAIKLYKESIKYDEYAPTVYNNLATAYKRLGEYENSILLYNKSLSLDSKNPIRYLRPAFVYAYTWQEKEAVELLKKYFDIWWNDISFIELCKNTTQWWGELLKLYNTL